MDSIFSSGRECHIIQDYRPKKKVTKGMSNGVDNKTTTVKKEQSTDQVICWIMDENEECAITITNIQI